MTGIKTVGHGIAVGGEAVWKGIKWLGGQVVDKITGVFERVMQWITRLPERVARLVLDLWEAREKDASCGRLSGGSHWAISSTGATSFKWLATLAVACLRVGLGGGEIIETIADSNQIQHPGKLTGGEVAAAASVFGSSIPFQPGPPRHA